MQDRPLLLLFDVLDTLVYNPFNKEIPAYFGLTQSELLEQKHPTAWVEFESGVIDETEYFRRYFSDQRSFDHLEFKRVVCAAYRFVDGAELLLRDLSDQGIEMHALSNYPIWFRDIEEKLRLSRFLEWSFVSCLTGVRKAAAEAYLGATRALDRPPQTCLFIDDSIVNCLAAEAAGMRAINFVDATTLRSELHERGIMR